MAETVDSLKSLLDEATRFELVAMDASGDMQSTILLPNCADLVRRAYAAGLRQNADKIEKALEFYANESTYAISCASDGGIPIEVPHSAIDEDRGMIACNALSLVRKEAKP